MSIFQVGIAFVGLMAAVIGPTSANTNMVSKTLQNHFIWSRDAPANKQAYVAFRKTFDLKTVPRSALLSLFADSRYILWVNGRYVLRGPNRFDPTHPEYDTIDIASTLKPGSNAVVVLVHSYSGVENGRMMRHAPGLALHLDLHNQAPAVTTDSTWRCNADTRYLPSPAEWGSIPDNIDARKDSGDWTQAAFEDAAWNHANKVDGKQWGTLAPRSIPLLRETPGRPKLILLSEPPGRVEMPYGQAPPLDIPEAEQRIYNLGTMLQAYVVLDFNATEGTVLEMDGALGFFNYKLQENYRIGRYVARAGKQSWMTGDVWGMHYLTVRVVSGSVTGVEVKIVNRTYPFDMAGKFHSGDAMLDELWKRGAHTVALCSEDGYLDCTPRERVEWMGDAALVEYPVTRAAFTSPDTNNRSDARLIRQMLRHIAQSQQPDGRLKAHHPSDRWDIHGVIEDYACLWVSTLRACYDNTGDAALVSELWPALVKQMAWFHARVVPSGLVNAREFLFFDNPLKYKTCEGATLNAYLYGALRDASYLAQKFRKPEAAQYAAWTAQLDSDYNKTLWNEQEGTYDAALMDGKRVPPTAHAAMTALYFGIVPIERRERVLQYLVSYRQEIGSPYAHRLLLEVLFQADTRDMDTLALDIIRERWQPTIDRKDLDTVFEGFNGGSQCHNMGATATYLLSAYTLGVQTENGIASKMLRFAPHPGSLTHAEGVVVTEHGLVPVSWQITPDGAFHFTLTIPPKCTAHVALPVPNAASTLMLNGKEQAFQTLAGRLHFTVKSGKFDGVATVFQ